MKLRTRTFRKSTRHGRSREIYFEFWGNIVKGDWNKIEDTRGPESGQARKLTFSFPIEATL